VPAPWEWTRVVLTPSSLLTSCSLFPSLYVNMFLQITAPKSGERPVGRPGASSVLSRSVDRKQASSAWWVDMIILQTCQHGAARTRNGSTRSANACVHFFSHTVPEHCAVLARRCCTAEKKNAQGYLDLKAPCTKAEQKFDPQHELRLATHKTFRNSCEHTPCYRSHACLVYCVRRSQVKCPELKICRDK